MTPAGFNQRTGSTMPAAKRSRLSLAFGLLGVAVFAVALVVGFLLGLPVSALEHRLVYEVAQRTPYRLTIEESRLVLPLGLQAEGVVLRGEQVSFLPLTVDRLQVAPAWLRLMTFDPTLAWEARLLEGALTGDIRSDGRWQTTGGGLVFDLPLRPPSELALSGRLVEVSGQGSFDLQPATTSQLEGRLAQLVLRGLGLTSGNYAGLFLGQAVVKVTGRGRSFDLEELQVSGGALEVRGQGRLMLAADPAASRINLALELRPAANAPAGLTDLLGVVARRQPDGLFRLSINGTLTHPVLRP